MTAAASSSRIPFLPNELLQHIIHLALPPPGYSEFTQRSTTLRSCTFVCQSWRWTRHELLRDVVLRSPEHAALFRQVLEDHEALAEKVEVIRLGAQWERLQRLDGGERYGLAEMLRRCVHVKELQIGRVEGILFSDLNAALGLRTLYIWDSTIEQPANPGSNERPLFLPHLRYLFLDDVALNSMPSPIFTHHALPSLAALVATRTLTTTPFGPARIDLVALMERDTLHAISIREGVFHHRYSQNHVNLLHCDVEQLRQPSAFNDLPTSLRFLRITSGHFFGSDILTPSLRQHRPRLVHLEELILPLRLETAAAFGPLRAWAKREGIRITYERDEEGQGTAYDEGFWTCVRRVERIVEEEERRAQVDGEADLG